MSERAAEERQRALERDLHTGQEARERYLSELAATAATARDERALLAADGAATEADPALAVLTDTTQPGVARVAVIQRLGAGLTRRPEAIDALLAIVQDAEDDGAVRAAALDALGGAAFQVARFRPHQEAYERALRTLVTDGETGLRETAVSTLAVQHDPEVQQTLLAGLRGDGELPVDRERAIQLLAEDDHLDNLPWLRELYHGGSDDARQEAVRLMGAYAGASDLLTDVLRDGGETAEVRQQSAASLRNLAPERFEDVAKQIATDPGEDPEVRTACLTTLEHLGDADRVYGDADFLRRLADVGGDESAPQVAEGARRLIGRRRSP